MLTLLCCSALSLCLLRTRHESHSRHPQRLKTLHLWQDGSQWEHTTQIILSPGFVCEISKKESFWKGQTFSRVDVWRVYWAENFEWEAKRPCLLLLDLEYTSNIVDRGGWMGTCVIDADMLNEGYQSMEVWHEGKVRRSERREERKETCRRDKRQEESDREKERVRRKRYMW